MRVVAFALLSRVLWACPVWTMDIRQGGGIEVRIAGILTISDEGWSW